MAEIENIRELHIFCENIDGYSATRLTQEAEKRGIIVFRYSFKDLFVCEDGVYFKNNKKIEISKSKEVKIWFLSHIPLALQIAQILNFQGLTPFPLINEMPLILVNKFLSNCFVSSIGFSTPKTCYIENKINLDYSVKYIGGFPCVIKKCNGSRGKFVEKVDNKNDILKFVKNCSLLNEAKFSIKSEFLLQEYIADSVGVDYRVLCFQGEILGGMRRSSNGKDFRSNFSLGGSVEIFEIPNELKAIVLKIIEKSRLFIVGLDFIKSKDEWLCIETNIMPQFQGFEKATNVNVAKKIIEKLFDN